MMASTSSAPILPNGIAECEGIPRTEWYSRAVTLRNDFGVDVARGLCMSVDYEFVSESGGEPLGDRLVAVLIAEILDTEVDPVEWMYDLKPWPITQVFLNGASLYDHEQRNLFNVALQRFRLGPTSRRRQYNNENRKPNNLQSMKKREEVMTSASINFVSSASCCSRNCVQPFPRSVILDLRAEFYRAGSTLFRKHVLLDVHRQVHKNIHGNPVITLHGIDVCREAWCLIMGVGRATFYRYQKDAIFGARASHHGNTGVKKPRAHTLQAIATLGDIIDNVADYMPHKSTTLGTGEKVASRLLPCSFQWNGCLSEINNVNSIFGLRHVSKTGLSKIRTIEFRECKKRKRVDNFACCGTCDEIRRLKAAATQGSTASDMWKKKLEDHHGLQRAHRLVYYGHRKNSVERPDDVVCIIHDKMDHSKTASPHFSHKSKSTDFLMKLPISVTGMIAHGHGDVRYAHYGLDIFPIDSNHTIGSIAKVLRDLERPPLYSSRALFYGGGSAPIFEAILAGASEICICSLPPTPIQEVPAKPLPPVLQMQLDNSAGDNKNRYVLAFFSLLIVKGIFREVTVNFLLVGHTHDDIDALFGRWSALLRSKDFPTIPLLMKSFIDVDSIPVIPHLIEEVPDFKNFIAEYLGEGDESLQGHTNAQQFRFYMDSSGEPKMQYRILCTDRQWLPIENGGIQLWKRGSDGRIYLPIGEPRPIPPRRLRHFDEILKGISGFLTLWECMANDDLSGDFRRKNEHILQYWRSVIVALHMPLLVETSLQENFWPESRYIRSLIDEFEVDGRVREEYDIDVPFIGQRCHHPPQSFRVGRDVYAGYVMAIPLADGDDRPFWLSLVLSDSDSDRDHPHEIQMQYLKPPSTRHVDVDTYCGWDSQKGNFWIEDSSCDPMWCNTDCILTAWKRQCRKGGCSSPLKVSIPKRQVDIIKASISEF